MNTAIQISKPMLAGKCEQMSNLRFPVLATPKLDGIRCLKIGGRALTRSFKPISNVFTRRWIERHLPDGVDGELMVLHSTFSETAGHIGRHEGEPNFRFHVFDYVSEGVEVPYACRMQELARLPEFERVQKVLPLEMCSLDQLAAYEERCIAEGYEGVMVRTPDSPYKCGRSTEREGWLLKIKRFEDAEAVVLECIEGLSNNNPAEKDAFGRTKRSSCMENKVGRGTLGAFVVRDVTTGIEFRLSGFDAATAASIWENRKSVIGRMVRYKHQPSGAKEAPRFPKFSGFREPWDL